jgi:hypothetical protein
MSDALGVKVEVVGRYKLVKSLFVALNNELDFASPHRNRRHHCNLSFLSVAGADSRNKHGKNCLIDL